MGICISLVNPGPKGFIKMRLKALQDGMALFNAAHFFDAHEILEDVWRLAPRNSALRRHLQGLVQLAVAFHHQSTGNYSGARSVLKRAVRNLEGAEESLPELNLGKLRLSLDAWQKYLDWLDNLRDGREVASGVLGQPATSIPPPELPRVMLRKER